MYQVPLGLVNEVKLTRTDLALNDCNIKRQCTCAKLFLEIKYQSIQITRHHITVQSGVISNMGVKTCVTFWEILEMLLEM